MFVKRSLPAATSSAAEATKRPKVQSVLRAAIDDANTSAQEELERRRVELDEANEQRELLAPTPPGVRGGAERQLSAPPPFFEGENVATTTHTVYGCASQMGNMLSRMGTVSEDVVLDFAAHSDDSVGGNGLHVRQMHPTGVIMAVLHIPRDAFIEYRVPHAASYSLYYEQIKGFSSACNVAHTLEFFEAPRRYPDKFCGRMHSAASDRLRIFDTRDASMAPAPLDLPFRDWPYPLEVVLSAKTFAAEIKACVSSAANDVEFSANIDKQQFIMTSCGGSSADGAETGEMRVRADSVTLINGRARDDIKTQRFSIDFLKVVSGFTNDASTLTIRYGLFAEPVWFAFAIENSTARIDVLLTCKE